MAEAKKLNKTLYFLRATFDGKPMDFQQALTKARNSKPNVGDTEIKLAGGDVLRIQRSLPSADPYFYQVTRYLPGERAPTLIPNLKSPEDNEGSQEAPTGSEFKDGECFFHVNNYNVVYLGNGISISKARLYFQRLFEECGLDRPECQFDFTAVANIDKLELMQQQGVRSLKLFSSAFDVSIPKPQRTSWWNKVLGSISDEISCIIERDDTIEEQKAAEDLIVTVEVRLDGNTYASDDAKQSIEHMAETVIGNELGDELGGFAIETRSGVPIRPSEVRLQKTMSFSVVSRSIDSLDAKTAMDAYYSELSELGLLEL